MVEIYFFLYDEESQTAEKIAKRGQPQIKQFKTVALNKNKNLFSVACVRGGKYDLFTRRTNKNLSPLNASDIHNYNVISYSLTYSKVHIHIVADFFLLLYIYYILSAYGLAYRGENPYNSRFLSATSDDAV